MISLPSILNQLFHILLMETFLKNLLYFKRRKRKHNKKRKKKSQACKDNTISNTIPLVTPQISNKYDDEKHSDRFTAERTNKSYHTHSHTVTPRKQSTTINNNSDTMRSIYTQSKHPVHHFIHIKKKAFINYYKDV